MFRVQKVVSYLNENDNKTIHRQNLDNLGLRFRLFYETWLYEPFLYTLCKRHPFKPYGEVYKNPRTNWVKNCEEKRLKKIEDLINKTIKIGFIEPKGFSDYLVVTQKGREFLRPIYFVEYSAREFGFYASLISGFLIGLGSTLLIMLF